MNKPTLVIMAAGLGSRFGGPKQVAPVDAQQHVIMDFSIYDAIRAGFSKVVCIVKAETEADIRERIGDRIAPFVEIAYAHQSLDALPEGFSVPEGREKPWGTAHAVLCAKHLIDGPFAVINADDFYGSTAYAAIYDFLSEKKDDGAYAMVGYKLSNTLSDHGHVARGVCEVSDAGKLVEIHERTHIEKRPGGGAYTEDGEHFTFLPGDTYVSLNLWGYQRAFLDEVEARFAAFLKSTLVENPLRGEYFLPTVTDQLLTEGKATVNVLPTEEKWYGVTYREDMQTMQDAIAQMKRDGLYPELLWRK